MQLHDMVRQQAAHDVDPPLGQTASYIKNEMTTEGYRHLLAVGGFAVTPHHLVMPCCNYTLNHVYACTVCWNLVRLYVIPPFMSSLYRSNANVLLKGHTVQQVNHWLQVKSS